MSAGDDLEKLTDELVAHASDAVAPTTSAWWW